MNGKSSVISDILSYRWMGNLDNAKSAILSEVEAVLDAPQEEA